MEATHIVGIDLGTTNTVVSCLPIGDESGRGELVDLYQVTEPGMKGHIAKLPSFLLQPLETEREQQDFTVPWNEGPWVVGVHAKDRGAEVPNRSIASAKSWLCQSKVNRKEAMLPFKSDEDMERLSPFSATVLLLEHIAGAWHEQKASKLGDQEVIITVPASFDEEARKLTEEAACSAGIKNLTILEEPTSALYAWLAAEGEAWRDAVDEGDVILVCDIGGE
jgi:molecular chaperone DnaK (HSP70)